MNHLESRMIGGINSSIQNRIALVDERFISETLSSFVADAGHPDCPSNRSAGRFQTQISLEIVFRSIRHLPVCPKIFVSRIFSPLIGCSAGSKWPPADAVLR